MCKEMMLKSLTNLLLLQNLRALLSKFLLVTLRKTSQMSRAGRHSSVTRIWHDAVHILHSKALLKSCSPVAIAYDKLGSPVPKIPDTLKLPRNPASVACRLVCVRRITALLEPRNSNVLFLFHFGWPQALSIPVACHFSI